jgi:hypothetical protein
MEPTLVIASIMATRAQAALAHSALPDAPVLRDPQPKPRRVRARTASVLYRIADAVSPPVGPAAPGSAPSAVCM